LLSKFSSSLAVLVDAGLRVLLRAVVHLTQLHDMDLSLPICFLSSLYTLKLDKSALADNYDLVSIWC
jgi:hypothetical protein